MTATPDERNLPHTFRAIKRPAWSVPEVVLPPPPESLALPCPESQQLSGAHLGGPPAGLIPVDDAFRAALLAPVRERWESKAHDRSRTGAVREYAEKRAAALARPVSRKVGECGTRGVTVMCACPGRGKFRPFGCRQWWLCGRCRADRSPRLSRRLREGLASRMAEAAARWGRTRDERPRFVMLTLTVPHSGDLAADREALAAGWRRFYLRVRDEIAKRRKALVPKIKRWRLGAADGIGRFPYAGVWEVTPSDGGHIHMHVAVIWPYLKFKLVREWWRKACPGSEHIGFSWKRRDGKASTPSSIANYLGKYLSKGSDGNFSPSTNAEISAAMYNKRSVTASRHFWVKFTPECPCCHSTFHVVLIGFPEIPPELLAQRRMLWPDDTPDDDPIFESRQWDLPMSGLDAFNR